MLRYLSLGPVEVVDDDVPVPLGGQNQRALVAMLLANRGRAVSVGALAEGLWPARAGGSERHAIQTVVSRVRCALGADREELGTTAEGYRLSPAHSDAVDFEALAAGASERAPADAVAALDEALRLWRGVAFGELADLPPVRVEAVRLDQLRWTATESRFGLLVDLGRYGEVIPELEAFVALEPLRERSRALLMQALYWSHRQADALAAYRNYRDVLGDGQGLEPSLDLKKLEESILADSLDRRTPAPAGQPRLHGRRGRSVSTGPDAATLERQGWDRLWDHDHEGSVDARQRAYVQLLRDGDKAGAARVAIWLGVNAAIRLKGAVAFGWLGRAQQLLARSQNSAQGLLLGLVGMVEVLGSELEAAREHGEAARAIGLESGDSEIEAFGKTVEGWATVRLGDRRAGLRLMDQAMASAVGGEVGRYLTGLIYCRTLCACLDLMDYQRANEWTDEIASVKESGGVPDLHGDCRTHRATVLAMKGDLDEAEHEAWVACSETADFDMTHLAVARNLLGQICLWRADLDGAESHLVAAQEMGQSAQPALALVQLARGAPAVAADMIADATAEAADDPLRHAQLLPAQVEIALACGHPAEAAEAAGVLAEIAAVFGTTALRASADHALGRAAAPGEEPGAALRSLRRARRGWLGVGAKHQAARCQLHLAEALLAAGRSRDASIEVRAARRTLVDLGATLDLQAADQLLARIA